MPLLVSSPALIRRRPRVLVLAALAALSSTLLGSGVPARAAAPAYLSGPDVSHYQHAAGPVDFAKIAAAGQSFVISKATESTTFTDQFFAADFAAERANGLIRGGYHYARPQLPISTAVAQADYYTSVLGNIQEAGDLPGIIDLETSGGLSAADLITWTQTFLDEVMTRTGRTPIVYTYRDFWRTALLNSAAFTRYPLWIADWTAGATVPTPPLIGTWPTWALWQWTSTARLPGVTGIVDDSHFNGTAAQLAAFADGTNPTTLPPVAPSAPISVQAGPAGNALKVSWVPGDNGGRLVTSYKVTVTPGGATLTVPGSATSAVVPGLAPNQLYTAAVVATSPVGSSPASTSSTPIGATAGIVPASLTLTKASATVVSGRNAEIRGTLQRVDGLGGVGSAPLVVFAKPTGASDYTAVTSVITEPDGTFGVQVTSGTTTRYDIRYAGGAGFSAASDNILIYARASVTTALNKLTVPPKAHVTLRGQVSVAAAGRQVYRQRWYANSWHSGPAATVAKDGRYSFTVQPTVRGKTKLRVILSSKNGLVGAYSKTVVLNVR